MRLTLIIRRDNSHDLHDPPIGERRHSLLTRALLFIGRRTAFHLSDGMSSARLTIDCWVFEERGKRHVTLSGQVARTLVTLLEAGGEGCTARDASDWSYRFSSYVHQLRHRHGLRITTAAETHPNGRHARYFLETTVRVSRAEWLPR